MYLAAYLVPPLLFATGIGLALLTTYQHWNLTPNLLALGQTLFQQARQSGGHLPANMSAAQLGGLVLLGEVIAAFSVALVINSLFTFGEEFGWRGYLLPRLAPLGGLPAAVLVGAIWGLWHAPLIVLDGYNYPGHPWLGIPMMMLFCVALSIIFTWLRFRSGSIWTTVLAHAAINAQAGFAILLLSPADSLLRPPIGLLGLLPMFAFATFLVLTGRLKPDTVQ